MHKILDLVMTFIVVLSCTSVVYGMDDDDAKKASSLRLLHKSLSSSDSGDENEKAPQNNINEKEKDLAPFLTVWVDKNIIFISGLKIVNNEEAYQFMIKKMATEVSCHIQKGWLDNHKKKQYKQLNFLSSTFNEDLLTDIGKELSIHHNMPLKTHFYQCCFEQANLHKCLQQAAGFKKKSTFKLCKEGE